MYARDQAATLAHVALRLQRCKAEAIDKLLEEASQCLYRFKMARNLVDPKNIASITEQVTEDLSVAMQSLGTVIKDTIAPHAYALLVFDVNDDGTGVLNYVSNANVDDVCTAMREFIDARAEELIDSGDKA